MSQDFPKISSFMNLAVADVVIEAKKRLAELIELQAKPERTESEKQALGRSIEELRRIIRRNVC